MHNVMNMPTEESKDPAKIEAMFSRIAPRYDITNRLLSAGFDMSWRRRGVKMADPSPDARMMDMGCGTADMMSVVLKRHDFKGHTVGVDLSQPMLDLAGKKLGKINTGGTYEFRHGDALSQADTDGSYDLIMTCFGARNFADMNRGFSEVHRLLKPGGRFLVIEFFAMEKEPWYIRLYLKYILPFLGAIISGRRFAYSYLSRSKQGFYMADDFCKLGEEHGLKVIGKKPATFGVAEIIVFEKEH
jgi:demethylmenaquinone methyltransferase/2-methoxy-6-polyprenyl-1,4-benzoquinol methylase